MILSNVLNALGGIVYPILYYTFFFAFILLVINLLPIPQHIDGTLIVSSFNTIWGYLYMFPDLIPTTTILTIFALIVTFEFGIIVFQKVALIISWVHN